MNERLEAIVNRVAEPPKQESLDIVSEKLVALLTKDCSSVDGMIAVLAVAAGCIAKAAEKPELISELHCVAFAHFKGMLT